VSVHRANLNNSYFTNRQDRYIHFTFQPNLAEYCFSFLNTVSSFSYRLQSSQSQEYSVHWPQSRTHPHDIHSLGKESLSRLQSSHLHSSGEMSLEHDVLIFPVLQAGQFNICEEEQCLTLLFDHLSSKPSSHISTPLVDLTSGYFGLYQPYQDLILKSPFDCRIIAAAPKVVCICSSDVR
jgi:CDP-diacylglycerol---glycerol-3-phosphate 3-phosphatidyltransferase